MLELDTISKFFDHVGMELPPDETISVGELEPGQFVNNDFEPFRHHIYSIML